MANRVCIVEVPEADRRELQRRARSKGVPARVVERARIVLLAADGVPGKQIAAQVSCAEPTVVTWRRPPPSGAWPDLKMSHGRETVAAAGGAAGSGAGADADRATH